MSRIAFISDIHGNIDALKAVLADIDRRSVDEIICLGDIVGYGAAPAECVKLIRERCSATVIGNHDFMTVFEGVLLATESVNAGIIHARNELSIDDKEWLKSLPFTLSFPGFEVVHASLYEPNHFHYITYDDDVQEHFFRQKELISFVGHTHVPLTVRKTETGILWNDDIIPEEPIGISGKMIINVGSVGQPRDEDPRACYAIFDEREVQFHRVEYDVLRAAERIMEAKLPPQYARRLIAGR